MTKSQSSAVTKFSTVPILAATPIVHRTKTTPGRMNAPHSGHFGRLPSSCWSSSCLLKSHREQCVMKMSPWTAPSFLALIPLAGEGHPRSGSRAEIREPVPLNWRSPGGQDSAAPYECADVARDTNPKPNSDRVRTLPALPVSSDQNFASNHPCPEKSGSRSPRKCLHQ